MFYRADAPLILRSRGGVFCAQNAANHNELCNHNGLCHNELWLPGIGPGTVTKGQEMTVQEITSMGALAFRAREVNEARSALAEAISSRNAEIRHMLNLPPADRPTQREIAEVGEVSPALVGHIGKGRI